MIHSGGPRFSGVRADTSAEILPHRFRMRPAQLHSDTVVMVCCGPTAQRAPRWLASRTQPLLSRTRRNLPGFHHECGPSGFASLSTSIVPICASDPSVAATQKVAARKHSSSASLATAMIRRDQAPSRLEPTPCDHPPRGKPLFVVTVRDPLSSSRAR